MEAVNQLMDRNMQVLIGLHPGDPNDRSLYMDIERYAGCKTRIVGKHVGIKTSDIVVGCDIVVEFNSTIGIQAAHLRKPVIDFCTTIALKGQKPIEGKDPWKMVGLGASDPVYYGSVEILASTIHRLLIPERFAPMKAKQELAFPIPLPKERGLALKKMVEALT